jgi:hypothetical protein
VSPENWREWTILATGLMFGFGLGLLHAWSRRKDSK